MSTQINVIDALREAEAGLETAISRLTQRVADYPVASTSEYQALEFVRKALHGAQQGVQDAVPATNHSETPNSSTIIVPYGWKLVPDGATPDWVANLEALPDWREAVGECIKRFLAAAPAHPAEGVPAPVSLIADARRLAYVADQVRALEPEGSESDVYLAEAADVLRACADRIEFIAATHPTQQGLDAEYQRGYQDGYNRRDAEVKGALV